MPARSVTTNRPLTTNPQAAATTGGEYPLRDAGVTIACPICGQGFRRVGRRRFCSAACRQAAFRQRHSPPRSPLPLHASRPARPVTMYECPACGARFLGEQRCPDCNVFCRRIGPGGHCPHCDEPVAVTDLIPRKGGEPDQPLIAPADGVIPN
jgi:ssDNA-binding Zn-finger/Zn-ribbon topoisomerase 1